MFHSHQLTANHQDFLNQNRIDPITGEKIEEGHTVVVCAACKSAFFIESWEYLGHSHCDQTETLKFLPLPQTLYLKANNKYTQEVLSFGFADSPMFMSNNVGCVFSIFGGFISIIFSLIIGEESNEIVGWMAFFILFGSCLTYGIKSILPAKTKNKSIKEMENMQSKFSIYIDYKLRGLAIENNKTKELREFFDFARITEFKYHIIYHPNTNIDALYCQLQIRIKTRVRKENYFATIHRDTIPEWSEFISKLPTDLRIINTPFPAIQ
ncbi:hypothetical protein [Bernardetia sp.]|uniref:hypothetical protein n=1 Tax=Bernardetia sp. TaxID=1937974 RepID=UPI0025B8581E|nr:hypothetical protein [Bernardetia sp.]